MLRYELLGGALKKAIEHGILREADMYKKESTIINKIKKSGNDEEKRLVVLPLEI